MRLNAISTTCRCSNAASSPPGHARCRPGIIAEDETTTIVTTGFTARIERHRAPFDSPPKPRSRRPPMRANHPLNRIEYQVMWNA